MAEARQSQNDQDTRRRMTVTGKEDDQADADPNPSVAQQKKTFRRWVNSHLETRKMYCSNLITDLSDGILLAALMEIIATTTIKVNTKPKIKIHFTENLNKSLQFIEKHVKLVNIGANDLYECNQTIILGLIWTLILRWGVRLGDGGKKGLSDWFNGKVGALGGVPIKNFDKDFQDGMKFCALVKSVDPEFNMDGCDPSTPIENMDKAFMAAEENLNIPILLDPKDVVEHPDEKSVMTYVGLFFNEFGNRDDTVKRVKAEKPVVTNATATTADVAFTMPEGCKSIRVRTLKPDGSVVDERPFDRETFVPNTEGQGTFQLTGLEPGTDFKCDMIGVKEKDDKETEPSAPCEFATSKVGAPRAPMVQATTASTADLELEPVDGAQKYEILVASPASSKNFDRKVPVPDGQTKVTVDGLAPGTEHAFKVVGILASGDPTEPSAASPGVTAMPPVGLPKVDNITDQTAAVNVPADDSNPAGTKYKVQVMDPEDPKANWLNGGLHQDVTSKDASNIEVDELEPEHPYQLRVIAVSPDGVQSAPSEAVAFTTLPEQEKQRVAVVTSGNTPNGVEIVRDICAIDSKYGKFHVVYVCVREDLGDSTQSALELRELKQKSDELPEDSLDCRIHLVNYTKKNADSVKEASKMLKGSKVHLIVNNAKLNREQLSSLVGA